jgi:glycolate oxidase FAD binding subunit
VSAAGPQAPALEVDGVEVAATFAPESGDALAHTLAECAAQRLGLVVRGGGSQLGFGNLPRGAIGLLDTHLLAGIEELDAEEGVARVRAGTPLAELREAARAAGFELPLDPPGARSTLGGALAAAAIGPRAQGLGLPRDGVLGLDVALTDGTRTRCGGRVVKNVTGYDLAKLYVGSFGSLCVIESAWLRLRPRPERVEVVTGRLDPGSTAYRAALDVARGASVRAAALVSAPLVERLTREDIETAAAVEAAGTRGPVLAVELAGDDAVVEAAARHLRERLGATRAPDDLVDRVREIQGTWPRPPGLRFRVASRASRLAEVAVRLESAGAELLAYPGLGLVYAGFGLAQREDDVEVERALAAAREAAKLGGGSYVLESAPVFAKRGRDVFGEPTAALAIARALKERFDPAGILNPGRGPGRL